MRSQVNLFACYPLAPLTILLGGIAFSMLEQAGTLAWVLLFAVFYCFLIGSLRGCRSIGGWAGRWYDLALGAVILHLVPVGFLLLNQDASPTVCLLALGAAYGVFFFCSLAGAEMANRTGRSFDAGLQLAWPLLFILLPWFLGRFSPVFFYFVVPLLTFGLQGLDALSLAFYLEQHKFTSPTTADSAPAIGWEPAG